MLELILPRFEEEESLVSVCSARDKTLITLVSTLDVGRELGLTVGCFVDEEGNLVTAVPSASQIAEHLEFPQTFLVIIHTDAAWNYLVNVQLLRREPKTSPRISRTQKVPCIWIKLVEYKRVKLTNDGSLRLET
jgi:hypothetical protein